MCSSHPHRHPGVFFQPLEPLGTLSLNTDEPSRVLSDGGLDPWDLMRVVAGLGVATTVFLGSTGVTLAQAIPDGVLRQPQRLAQVPASAQYLLFVNPTVGNDSSNGNQGTPLRTITRALQLAQSNTAILLSPGTYSAETGETFPLMLKPGVTIQGDPVNRGQGIVIRGGGAFISPTFARQDITMLGANQATLTGVTLTNPNPRGYGLWVESSSPSVLGNTFSSSTHDGISITGGSNPLIQGNAFVRNGANGMTIYGTSQPQVRENVFDQTGFGINIAQNAAPVIVGNQITRNRDGVVVQGNARPMLRNNTIEGNRQDGVVAIAQSLPNLGTASEPGNNLFRNNGRYDINASATSQIVAAAGNQLGTNLTTGRLDLAGNGVVTRSVAAAPGRRSIAPMPTTASPAIAPAPVAPPASSGEFASLPRLQPAAPVLPAAPAGAVPQPTRPERLPLLAQPQQTHPSATTPAASFPHSRAVTPSSSPTPLPSVIQSLRSPGTRSSSQTTAIEIPVPPPASTVPRPANLVRQGGGQSGSQPRNAFSAPSPQPAPTAIEIPVPLPASIAAATPPANRGQTRAFIGNPSPQTNLLPVPGGDVPLGHIGDMPTVMVSRDPLRRLASVPSADASRAAELGLRYRVVVDADNAGAQAMVRSLVPGAFRTYTNGRVVMQAGAYSDRANADEAARMLMDSGLRATVQQIE